MRQQLVRGQIARLAPVEDSLGDVGGEIAEADKPREIGRADAFPLGQWAARGRTRAKFRPVTATSAGLLAAHTIDPSSTRRGLNAPRVRSVNWDPP